MATHAKDSPAVADRTREMLRKVRQVEIHSNRLARGPMVGAWQSIFKGHGLDFEEVREYQPGDDVRSIDWNVTAKAGKPFIKKFREERELTFLLAIDVSASGVFGSGDCSKRERAAELACTLALSATRNNDKVGLVLFSDSVELYVPPSKGRRHVLRLVRDILFFKAARPGTDIAKALAFLCRVQRRQSIVFLISDFILPGAGTPAQATHPAWTSTFRNLSLARQRHEVVCFTVSDPLEAALPDVGRITLEDAETDGMVEFNSGDATARRRQSEAYRRFRSGLDAALRRAGVDSVPVSTSASFIPALTAFFARRGRRR